MDSRDQVAVDPTKLKSKSLDDWVDTWKKGFTGWHIDFVDQYVEKSLQKHIDRLTGGSSGQHILVPLCGRSLDLKWLVDQGHSVVGVEIYTGAVSGIFSDAGLSPKVTSTNNNLTLYEACEGRLKVFAGDMFALTSNICGPFDYIWDKHSFGAIQPTDRERYVGVCQSLLKPQGRILMCAFLYNQSEMCGPPFAITADLLKSAYGDGYGVEFLETREPNDQKLKAMAKLPNLEEGWHLLTKQLS